MKEKFSKMVEQCVSDKRIPYMEAVIELSEKHKIELEDIKKILTPAIKSKIEAEARSLHFLPKIGTLPID